MRITDFLVRDNSESFLRERLTVNFRRWRIFALLIIGFELILAISDLCASIMNIDNRFWYNHYLLMYIIMIILNAASLVFINRYKDLKNLPHHLLKKLESRLVVYMTLIMCWGSVVSLLDQRLYGNLSACMVNIITCSVLFYVDNKKIIIPYLGSVLILFVGLPYFQESTDKLIGHYINLSVFVIISWLASRIIYHNYFDDFKARELLKKTNILLKKEIENNQQTNMKLALASYQLSKFSLIDELTGIPNRRSFRNFIDLAFESQDHTVISIIMIDIDLFKEYNDHYGHNAGDNVLIAVANEINSVVRDARDFAARWGGEEFIYISFDENEAYIGEVAETIRQKVYALHIPHEYASTGDYISVSLGTSTMKISGIADVSRVMEQADKALYLAKKSGRNCAVKGTE
ncbi:GGDEF domain-containing protein [Dehalobacter sp. DCM]|uniref:diguanylate cyclase n=1 Tax=Dehalobacter sp. DCM TaxID=2907827 RepID=UPI003081EA58|nr:GGDEF domain-containing protein [Dehalobacter sp. DCM]